MLVTAVLSNLPLHGPRDENLLSSFTWDRKTDVSLLVLCGCSGKPSYSWEVGSVASATAPWDSGCCAFLHMKDREVAALITHKLPCVTNEHLQVNLFSVQKSICHSPSIWFRTSTDSVWISVYDLRNKYQLFTIVYRFFPAGTIDIVSFIQPL